MHFKMIRKCLDDIERVWQKLDNDEELSEEDENTFTYFENRLAEAIVCEWDNSTIVANNILSITNGYIVRQPFDD